MNKWECFSDKSYFDLWAVRNTKNKDFYSAIHVRTQKEAEFLVGALNRLDDLEEKYEMFVEWAFSMCNTYCEHLSDEIIHAPNCPVADLGIKGKSHF